MAFCGCRLGAETVELWCGGRNPLRRELASTLTSRSHGILQLFKEQRHVSGDAPLWAHFSFMYCSGLLQGFVGVQKRGNCALFFMHRIFRRRDMSANRKASDSRNRESKQSETLCHFRQGSGGCWYYCVVCVALRTLLLLLYYLR